MKTKVLRGIKVSCFILIISLLFTIAGFPMVNVGAATTGYIAKVSVDKARYAPGNTVTITANLQNTTSTNWSGTVYLSIYHHETLTYSTSKTASVSQNSTGTTSFTWTAPSTDYRGYLVKVYVSSSDYKTAAVDVSSDSSKFPRYGYIAKYDASTTSATVTQQIQTMAKDYYIDMYQFYDWMWRHEVPLKRTNGVDVDSSWEDLFYNTVSLSTLQNYMNAVHNYNGTAMAYMMSYAARENYSNYGVNYQWGLYWDAARQYQMDFNFSNGHCIYMFAPTNAAWQTFISNAYKDCINTLGFDGIQMDQMGQRTNIYDFNGNSYDVENSFSSLINAVKTSLTSNNANKDMVTFNIVDGTVNGWALNDVSTNANTDFSFSEIWWLSNGYNDMRNYIEQLRSKSNGKAAVMAAYMNYNQNCGAASYEAENATYSGVDVASDHTGYTGTGFLQNFAQQGDYVQFTINAPESITYPLVFSYGNNSGSSATRTIYVDNVNVGKATFYQWGTWDVFKQDAYIPVYLTAGTHTIKVAYNSDDVNAINLDSLTLGQFNESSVRLADALFAASGASHIEIGAGLDDVVMLGNEYYPNMSKNMSLSLKAAMKNHYKFITAYENLLFDEDLTYSDQGNQYINISGQTLSGNGTAGSIYHMTRMTSDYDILHLINLSSESDNQWRNTTSAPTTKTNLPVKYYLSPNSSVTGVYLASPDLNEGTSQSLSYTTGTDSTGFYVSFTVPSLAYWDMIYIKRTVTIPSSNRYEAELAIKTNVTTNTNHTGYTGTGFVDGFAEVGDEITFQVRVTSDNNYQLNFRYANNTGYTATKHVYVDGNYVGTLSMSNLSNWDTWSTASLSTYLTQGVHTVCIYYDSSDNHAVNLDNLIIS